MDTVEEIKRRLDLVDYVSRTVPLQRSGRNFKACCPFHSERTPSFYVFPDRGTWRCFGQCGDGGDLFSFVEKRDGVTFKDALETLAHEAGVALLRRDRGAEEAEERLRATLEAAVALFQEQLKGAAGGAARAYLEERAILPETADTFRLGWAPDSRRLLREQLTAQGFTIDDLLGAGLVIQREEDGSVYDRFRGRLMIPISDERGRIVGLGGRIIGDGQPKYLNTPQTKLFDKSRILYGLNLARDGVRSEGVAIVVEGYMDVIGPWQAGFRNIVATMGTSLTEQHARALTRFTRRLVLAMDPDAAGRQAAERAGELVLAAASVPEMIDSARTASALSHGAELDLRVAPLPGGRDPDELTRDDPEAWRAAIDGAVPYVQFLLDRWVSENPVDSPLEIRRVISRLEPVLMAVRDPIERSTYVQRLAERLNLPASTVSDQLAVNRRAARAPRRGRTEAQPPARREPLPTIETPITPQQRLLAILLRYPELRPAFRTVSADIFEHAIDREVFRRWLAGDTPREANAEAEDDDPTADRLSVLIQLGTRLPEMVPAQALEAAQERYRAAFGQHLRMTNRAKIDALAEAERIMGASAVERIGRAVWEGQPVAPESTSVAEAVIEALEIGRSMHQWDDDEDTEGW